MRHGVSSRGRRGIGVHGRRAPATARGAPRHRGRAGHRRLERGCLGRRSCSRRSAAAYPSLVYAPLQAGDLAGLDVVFLALPHGQSQAIAGSLVDTVGHVVDLGADFRLPRADYEQWYGEAHAAPELLDRFAFGLPELYRAEIGEARARRRARLLSDDGRARARSAARTTGWSSRRASWSTRRPACRAPGGA